MIEQALEHLESALAILEPKIAEAEARYKKEEAKFVRRRKVKSTGMRLAWQKYLALHDMATAVKSALSRAKEMPPDEDS